ncbi:hypothetical protein [Symbiopectobacterium sp. RP]
MITASYAFLPHIRASVVIIFKSVDYKLPLGAHFNKQHPQEHRAHQVS